LKLGIIGLPGSGKSTVFRALTGGLDSSKKKVNEPSVGVVKVNDDRLDFLAQFHKPKKVTPAQVEYLDIGGFGESKGAKTIGDKGLVFIRNLDAFIHCVRFFDSPLLEQADPLRSFLSVQDELILSDMAVVEKRLERIEKDLHRGKKELAHEHELLKHAYKLLDENKPLRFFPNIDDIAELRSFAFLSAKPQLVLLNAGENKSREEIAGEIAKIKERVGEDPNILIDWLYADAEAEIATLSEEDAKEFLGDLQLEEGAKDRIIKKSFELLNLIVFFTAGEPEVRAWQITKSQNAMKAAGAIHSDIERGFIRAEIVAFAAFKTAGSMSAAQKLGKVRLEGKDYIVQDGDIILFRFNV
jgi:ribosome-binding ATPase